MDFPHNGIVVRSFAFFFGKNELITENCNFSVMVNYIKCLREIQ